MLYLPRRATAVLLPLVMATLLLAEPASAGPRVLVLTDSTPQTAWIADLYRQFLTNLFSHFDATVQSKSVGDYSQGDMAAHDATVYVGSTFGTQLPTGFLDDAMTSGATLCWMGYNLHQLAWNERQAAFEQTFGVSFAGQDFSVWPRVTYKDRELTRNPLGTDVGRLVILDPAKATAAARMFTAQGQEAPYILSSGNFHYVADVPFSFPSETDRGIAFADWLHDLLDIDHPELHRAILRIEDVHPLSDQQNMRAIADYLRSENVPFVVSVIPRFVDPLGVYDDVTPPDIPRPVDVTWRDVPGALDALRYMLQSGGIALQHGNTHQLGAAENPFTGASADDWEFYRIGLNQNGGIIYQGPVDGDSFEWALARVQEGRNLLLRDGIRPSAWLTPHYLASPVDYQAFASVYTTALDRTICFATDANDGTQLLEQIVPYLYKDVYGLTRIPETCGYVDPFGPPVFLPAAVLARAEANLAVRDGWAGMYFHWFLDVSYLQEVVTGVKALGYTFVAPPRQGSVTPRMLKTVLQ